jgi:hypothetical protein
MKRIPLHTVLMTAVIIAFVLAAIVSLSKIDVSKTLALSVTEENIVDYKYLEKYEVWYSEGRKKMIEHMKENNLKLEEGVYHFKQSTSFEKALEIFKFEKIE